MFSPHSRDDGAVERAERADELRRVRLLCSATSAKRLEPAPRRCPYGKIGNPTSPASGSVMRPSGPNKPVWPGISGRPEKTHGKSRHLAKPILFIAPGSFAQDFKRVVLPLRV